MEFTQKDVDVLNTRIEQTSDPEEKAALIKIRDEITEIIGNKRYTSLDPQSHNQPKRKDSYLLK